MMEKKTIVHKTSVEPKFSKLKCCMRASEKQRGTNGFVPAINDKFDCLVLDLQPIKIGLPEKLEKQVVE